MTIVNFNELPEIRKKYKNKKIVLCTGTFDLTHAGHVIFLEEARELGDILVVGVGNDFNVKHYKKGRPILNEHLRLRMIASLKPADHCFLQTIAHPPDAIIERLNKEFELLKPDLYVINEDAFNIQRRKEIAQAFGVPMKILKRTSPPEFEDISTTNIIRKIKDLYTG